MNTSQYRFSVAFSFAGNNKREKIRQIALLLCSRIEKNKIFFDEWFEAELAGHDADLYLQNIYLNESQLVVVCLCHNYNEKPWTQEEWRAIRSLERSLRVNRTDGADRMRLLPLRFDEGEVEGLFDTAIVPDVRSRDAEDVAQLIWERINLINPISTIQTTTKEPKPRSTNVKVGREITELDQYKFLNDGFEYLTQYFENSLDEMTSVNNHVKTDLRKIDANCFEAKAFVNGQEASRCGIWLKQDNARDLQMNFSFDGASNRNSCNDIVYVKNSGDILFFDLLGFTSVSQRETKKKLSREELAECLWKLFMSRM